MCTCIALVVTGKYFFLFTTYTLQQCTFMSAYTVLDGDTVQIEGRHFAGNRFTQAANSSKEI